MEYLQKKTSSFWAKTFLSTFICPYNAKRTT